MNVFTHRLTLKLLIVTRDPDSCAMYSSPSSRVAFTLVDIAPAPWVTREGHSRALRAQRQGSECRQVGGVWRGWRRAP